MRGIIGLLLSMARSERREMQSLRSMQIKALEMGAYLWSFNGRHGASRKALYRQYVKTVYVSHPWDALHYTNAKKREIDEDAKLGVVRGQVRSMGEGAWTR